MRSLSLLVIAASLLLLQSCSKRDKTNPSVDVLSAKIKRVAVGKMDQVLPTGTYRFINNVTFGSNPVSV